MKQQVAKITGVLGVALFMAGCAGPEQKLGRGIRNVTEFARLGEMSRSIEQTALWDGPDQAYSTGVARGFTRSVARTGLGVYEIVTFPFSPYDPKFTPKGYIAPDYSIGTTKYPYGGLRLTANPAQTSNAPKTLSSEPIFDTDSALGFSPGTVVSPTPGSRFDVFGN